MCTTACAQSTMIHSPLASPSMRGFGKPASRTASRTLAASALVWRLLVHEAMITRSNKEERCSVSNTTMSWALTSSKPSTMARWSFWVFLATVEVVIRSVGKDGVGQYNAQRFQKPEGQCFGPWRRGVGCRWHWWPRGAYSGPSGRAHVPLRHQIGPWPPLNLREQLHKL